MVKLSASKIKTLQHCSLKYDLVYNKHFPRSNNDGARRGTVTHLLLEMLMNPRHRRHFDAIQSGGLESSPACERLVRKTMKKVGLSKEEDFSLICEFVDVAVNEDFFMEGFELFPPEYEFDIKTEHYHLGGFIDKLGFKGDICRIEDFKTSKQKASGEDARFNLQALSYQLAVHKLFPNVKRSFVNFLYLKFKKNPRQIFSAPNDKLKGFEEFLKYLSEYLEDFGEDKAHSNYGWDSPSKKPLCGKLGYKDTGEKHFVCEHALPRTYYVLVKNGKVIQSEFDRNLLTESEGCVIEERHHSGCPRFMKYANK